MNASVCRQSARLASRQLRISGRRGFQSTTSLSAEQTYPLYPSVAALLKQHNIPTTEINSIPASGPKGRLLKGDVLSYLKSIPESYAADQSAKIAAMGHLDLSNIKLREAPKPEAPAPAVEAAPEPDFAPLPSEISLPISLAQVLSTQRKLKESLGTTVPVSTFLARAADLANENLPRAKGETASADELFDAVLGYGDVPTTSRGDFFPFVNSSYESSAAFGGAIVKEEKLDIIDILAGKKAAKKSFAASAPAAVSSSASGAVNVFSVLAEKGEERRAQIFLEKMNSILQVEPGRLVL